MTSEFTGKERDAETGLDYFLARYYSGAQGRFTSLTVADPRSPGQSAQPTPAPSGDPGRTAPAPQDATHRQNRTKKNWDKHTRTRSGDKHPPNYAPDREFEKPKEKKTNTPPPPKEHKNKYKKRRR